MSEQATEQRTETTPLREGSTVEKGNERSSSDSASVNNSSCDSGNGGSKDHTRHSSIGTENCDVDGSSPSNNNTTADMQNNSSDSSKEATGGNWTSGYSSGDNSADNNEAAKNNNSTSSCGSSVNAVVSVDHDTHSNTHDTPTREDESSNNSNGASCSEDSSTRTARPPPPQAHVAAADGANSPGTGGAEGVKQAVSDADIQGNMDAGSPSSVDGKETAGKGKRAERIILENKRLQRELQMEMEMLSYEVESVLEAKGQAEYTRKKSVPTEDYVRYWLRKADTQKRQVLLLREQCAKNKNIGKLIELQNRIREKEHMLQELKSVGEGLDKIRVQQEKAVHRVEQKNQDLPAKVKELQQELRLLKVSNENLRQERIKNEQESKRIHEAAVDCGSKIRRYMKAVTNKNVQSSSPACGNGQQKFAPEKQHLLDALVRDQERMQKEIEVLERAKNSDEKKYTNEVNLVQQEIKALQAKIRGFQRGIKDVEEEIHLHMERLQELKRLRAEYDRSKAPEAPAISEDKL